MQAIASPNRLLKMQTGFRIGLAAVLVLAALSKATEIDDVRTTIVASRLISASLAGPAPFLLIGLEVFLAALLIVPHRDSARVAGRALSDSVLKSVKGSGCGACGDGCSASNDYCNYVYEGGVIIGSKGQTWLPHRECGLGLGGCVNLGDTLCNWTWTGDEHCNPNQSQPGCPPPYGDTCTSRCN